MANLTKLKTATSLRQVAGILGVKPAVLSYNLYIAPSTAKYSDFEIPKSSGGFRIISAPSSQLKSIQRRLADILIDCFNEIERSEKKRKHISHGFLPKRTIMTNASKHKRRRFVLNADLQDFFPSLNYGRVRGFFIHDKKFRLHEKAATILAQIACHNNSLPQGSPCSPIISALVTNFLDIRLAKIAKAHRCTYTRYVDDLTFSTSQKSFPEEIAHQNPGNANLWIVGKTLNDTIIESGFKVNSSKTRMQIRGSRQTVTGLLVNNKVNIKPEYYRTARAMCDRLFQEGYCYKPVPAPLVGGPAGAPKVLVPQFLPQVEGIVNYIHFVKDASDHREKDIRRDKPTASTKLYSELLFFKHFVMLKRPLILAEGPSDYIYLKEAIKALPAFQPSLGSMSGKSFSYETGFLKYNNHLRTVMRLDGGSGALGQLINSYDRQLKRYKHKPLTHPVIIIVDNDDGAQPVFGSAKKYKVAVTHTSTNLFYRLTHNLYLVKTPESGKLHKSCIEDLFDPALLKTKVDGKDFDPHKMHNESGKYGKIVFAEKVVKADAKTIDFSGFTPLLVRIQAAIDDYKATPTT